jgi:hypothetical protein
MFYVPQGTVGGNSAVQQALQRAQMEQRPSSGGAIGRIEVPRPQVVQPRAPAPAHADSLRDDLMLGGSEAAPVAAAEEPMDANARRLAAARSSSAGRAAMSVAEARRMHRAEQAGQTDEVLQYIERARGAEAEGKQNVAKIYYEMAYRRATGELRGQIQAKLLALGSSP